MGNYSERIYERSHKATYAFWESCKNLSDTGSALCDPNTFDLLSMTCEFMYLFLFMTDGRLYQAVTSERRKEIMENLLHALIIRMAEGYLPDSPKEKKTEMAVKVSESYSARVFQYAECDRLAAIGDDTVSGNFMYAFGKRMAKHSNNENDISVILAAIAIGVDYTKELDLESLTKSIK